MRKLTRAFAPIVFVLSLLFSGCALPMPSSSMVSMDELPAYSDSAYVEIDGNQPSFTDADKQEPKRLRNIRIWIISDGAARHTPMSDRS